MRTNTDHIEFVLEYEHIDTRYRFTYHEFANLIEWEELVELRWWQKIFSTQDYVWKRVYFGHSKPLEKCLEAYNRGQAARIKS